MEKTTYDDEKRIAHLSSGETIYAVHKSTQCFGEVCPLHRPSDHELRDAPLHYDPVVGSFLRMVNGSLTIDPDDYNYNKYGTVILENAIICTLCNGRAVSTHRHHMAHCSCGESFTDGGSAYLRRGGSNWIDDSIIFRKDV